MTNYGIKAAVIDYIRKHQKFDEEELRRHVLRNTSVDVSEARMRAIMNELKARGSIRFKRIYAYIIER